MVRRNLVGTLLIASEEGSPLSGALRLAEALARRDGVKAHVFSVARPLSSPLSHLVCQIAGFERHELEAVIRSVPDRKCLGRRSPGGGWHGPDRPRPGRLR